MDIMGIQVKHRKESSERAFFHIDDALMGREKRLLVQVKYDTIAQKQGSSNNGEDHLGARRESQTIVSGRWSE
jgi:hypothetical protein